MNAATAATITDVRSMSGIQISEIQRRYTEQEMVIRIYSIALWNYSVSLDSCTGAQGKNYSAMRRAMLGNPN